MTKQAKLQLLLGFYRSNGLELSQREIQIIQRVASNQQRHATNLCNIPDWQETYDRWTERNTSKLDKILKPLSASYSLDGDPRGFCLKITAPNGTELAPHFFNE